MYDLKNYIVTPADEWTQLFKRTSGWFGGDGIFSFSMTGVESGKNPLDSPNRDTERDTGAQEAAGS